MTTKKLSQMTPKQRKNRRRVQSEAAKRQHEKLWGRYYPEKMRVPYRPLVDKSS